MSAPTLSMVWDLLDGEQRDEASKRVIEWLCNLLSTTDINSISQTGQYLGYHAEDIKKALENALKPEYRNRINDIVRALGVVPNA